MSRISTLRARAHALYIACLKRSRLLWHKYRALRLWQQVVIAALVLALLIGGIAFARSGGAHEQVNKGRTVTLASVGELSGTSSSVDLVGTVRSMTEANILAQTGGTVRAVHTAVGRSVPAGAVIAELENAAERAAVLQAEGSYEAALAARSGQSLSDTETTARNVYRSVFTTIDTTIENDIDTFFGASTQYGPDLLIHPRQDQAHALSQERARITTVMKKWEESFATADSRSPQALLTEAEANTRIIETFLVALADATNQRDSRATADQIAALATSRAAVASALSSITSARGSFLTNSTSATASSDAAIKQALGSLRGAQATLERTVVRAPIAGQVNFLPIRVGDYVTAFTHVATVAQNGALEIVVYVSEDDRDLLAAGGSVTVAQKYDGIITLVSPALDPTTKQIEVHVAVKGASDLVNGQSVHIAFPDLARDAAPEESIAGPLLLPLSAVKLRAGDRIVFTVSEDNRLVAYPVEVGEVRGDRIEILTPLPPELRIVRDARGLSDGEKVEVATTASVR